MEIISAMTNQSTLTELLRESLAQVVSIREVERDTGVQRSSLARFMAGTQSLRLDKADALAAYFGIECRRVGKKGAK